MAGFCGSSLGAAGGGMWGLVPRGGGPGREGRAARGEGPAAADCSRGRLGKETGTEQVRRQAREGHLGMVSKPRAG
jgi:hypothetical protein